MPKRIAESQDLQSMVNQGYNPLVAIQIALAGDAVKNLSEQLPMIFILFQVSV